MLDYNTENPVVRDEFWDDCAKDGCKYAEFEINYSPLDENGVEEFEESINKLIIQFDYAPEITWIYRAKELVIGGRMYEDEKEDLIDLCKSYGLGCDEV